MLCGAPSAHSWASRPQTATPPTPTPASSRSCPHPSVASASLRRLGLHRLRTGPLGRILSHAWLSANLQPRIAASPSSNVAVTGPPLASAKPQQRAPTSTQPAGLNDLRGMRSFVADPTPQPSPGSGPMAGSDPLLSHFTMPTESACCCQTCPQHLRRCSGPRPVLRPQPGSLPSLTTKASPSHRTICIAPCAAACASPSPSHRQGAEALTGRGAAAPSIPLATTPPRALAPGPWLDEPTSWSTRGCESHGRLLDRKAASFLSSG